MASNTIGNIIRVTSFGESHGPSVGVVIDGFPAGFKIDSDHISEQLARRRPGQSKISSERKEEDLFEIHSGTVDNVTTGHPIMILIRNKDARPDDYDPLKDVFRPNHADFTYYAKYGIKDHRGGGRSSARVTAGWVAAGAICGQWMNELGIEIVAYVKSIHTLVAEIPNRIDRTLVDQNIVRCPDPIIADRMVKLIEEAKSDKDSLGGIIGCRIKNCPIGLGDPVFKKLHTSLATAMFSINAVKGVEFGDGFDITRKRGSEVNDLFSAEGGSVVTTTNHSGGIQGGISNGQDIEFNLAFKPTSTIGLEQDTVNIRGERTKIKASGRHDPCVLPRAVPIVESMAAIVLADHYLMQRATTL